MSWQSNNLICKTCKGTGIVMDTIIDETSQCPDCGGYDGGRDAENFKHNPDGEKQHMTHRRPWMHGVVMSMFECKMGEDDDKPYGNLP